MLSIHPEFRPLIEEVLRQEGLNLAQSTRIAECVKWLSDFYIENPTSETPWHQREARIAGFLYYLVLNEMRARSVAQEALNRGFFEGIEEVIDFGAGPWTASWALKLTNENFKRFVMIEKSTHLESYLGNSAKKFFGESKVITSQRLAGDLIANPKKTVFVACYSLTETALPAEALNCEALLLIEPATQEDGRRLLELRENLIQRGYHVWAPCTHQLNCPLLHESKRDWCHDRVHVNLEPEWKSIEQQLPFRNQTITMSYLLMRKIPPPKWSLPPERIGRLTGDSMAEKGKTRQLLCRGPQREFLAWLHRGEEPPVWPRGVLVELPEEMKTAGNEIRPQAPLKPYS